MGLDRVVIYTGERRVDSPLKGEKLPTHVDNSSPLYISRQRFRDSYNTYTQHPNERNEVIP